jgi:hypothetical protein
MQSQRKRTKAMPPRKPLDKHKQQMSVSIEKKHRDWIREHWEEYKFRSESHAIDAAIDLLIERLENKSPPETGGRGQQP